MATEEQLRSRIYELNAQIYGMRAESTQAFQLMAEALMWTRGMGAPEPGLLLRVSEAIVEALRAEGRKAVAGDRFKFYVHGRLDSAGVSADPESPHKAAGCRVGGRLDELIGERDRLRAEVAELKALKLAYQQTPKQWSTALAPTLEAIAAAARQVSTAEENARLRSALVEAEAMLTVAMGKDLDFDKKTRDEIISTHPGMVKIRAALAKAA